MPWAHQAKEPGSYTSLPLQNPTLPAKLWYCPGKEMLVADALSCYEPPDAPEIPLDIIINEVHITPQKKIEVQAAIHNDPLIHFLAETITVGWPEDTKWCFTSSIPWYPNSQWWPHPSWQITQDSAHRKGESTPSNSWRPPRHNQASTMLNNVCTSLESIWISNAWPKHVLHAKVITQKSHDSHFNQPQSQSNYGNTLVLASSTLMDLSTSSSHTTTPRCQSFIESLHPNTMLQRQYLSWRSYLQNMEFQNPYALTMAYNWQMYYLLWFHWVEIWPQHQCTRESQK